MLAQKQLINRTSNYHIFDMTRGSAAGRKLTKKCGNYIGKLRSSFGKHENVLVNARTERSELGAVLFEKHSQNMVGDSTLT
jgi:tubby-related protein 1